MWAELSHRHQTGFSLGFLKKFSSRFCLSSVALEPTPPLVLLRFAKWSLLLTAQTFKLAPSTGLESSDSDSGMSDAALVHWDEG